MKGLVKIVLPILLCLLLLSGGGFFSGKGMAQGVNTGEGGATKPSLFTRIRHGSVQFIWGIIDFFSDLQASKAILPTGIEIELDVPYLFDGHDKHRLDVYYPEYVTEQLPVVVFIHGGGFVSGDKRQTQQYGMTLAKGGYVVFNLNYRLAPEHTVMTQIADVMAALTWIRENADRYRGDAGKMILAGGSAGAYLAGFVACLGTNPDLAKRVGIAPAVTAEEIQAVLLFSGVYDLETGVTRKFPGIRSDIEMLLGVSDIEEFTDVDTFSVLKNVTGQFPPTFVSSGEADPLHPESVEFVAVLQEKQVHYQALLFDKSEKKAFHDYQYRLDTLVAQQCMAGVLAFLETVDW